MIAFPPDFSFYVQIIALFVLMAALRELLFTPVTKVLDERRARTEGARAEAAALRAGGSTAAAEYDRRVDDVRRQLAQSTDEARNATSREERVVLDAAMAQASAALSQSRADLAERATAARSELAGEADRVADVMVERILGRKAA